MSQRRFRRNSVLFLSLSELTYRYFKPPTHEYCSKKSPWQQGELWKQCDLQVCMNHSSCSQWTCKECKWTATLQRFFLCLTRKWTQIWNMCSIKKKKSFLSFSSGYKNDMHSRIWSNGGFNETVYACSDSSHLVGGKLYGLRSTPALFRLWMNVWVLREVLFHAWCCECDVWAGMILAEMAAFNLSLNETLPLLVQRGPCLPVTHRLSI